MIPDAWHRELMMADVKAQLRIEMLVDRLAAEEER